MTAKYTSTTRWLISYMEKRKSLLEFARRRADQDMWVEVINGTLNLDISGDKKLYLLETDGLYHLTEHEFSVQNGPNDFDVPEGQSHRLS